MLREKRTVHEALMYKPKDTVPFSKDNNDFTYIEHGFYYTQIKNCLKYFKKEQLLVLEYEELKNPACITPKNIYFLTCQSFFSAQPGSKKCNRCYQKCSIAKGYYWTK